MYRTLALSILLCFVTFQVGITDTIPADPKSEDVTPEAPIGPTKTTPSPPTSATTTIAPPHSTNATTTIAPPLTTNATTTIAPPHSTNATTTTPTTPTTKPTAPTTAPTVPPTNGTSTTSSPPTTSAPSPSPSDRKFDAFSFLGGFALGLGLVAIGFLSWKFYLSRREDYYHTL